MIKTDIRMCIAIIATLCFTASIPSSSADSSIATCKDIPAKVQICIEDQNAYIQQLKDEIEDYKFKRLYWIKKFKDLNDCIEQHAKDRTQETVMTCTGDEEV